MVQGAVASDAQGRESHEPPLRYAGFWRRFVANFVDSLIVLPLVYGFVWVASSRTLSLILTPVFEVLVLGYAVVMHARWGQTLGKMVARIRVVRVTGEEIGWRESSIRSSVDIAFGVISTASSMVAMLRLSENAWPGTWRGVVEQTLPLEPAWGSWAGGALLVWTWSEVVVLLFNRKRRALHDYIAGTVVVRGSRNARVPER
jgi:uncharacterized RDD family membrane protein YckC